MNFKDIILFILVLIIIYLLYKTEKAEHFDMTNDIKTAINNKFKVDLQPMRELADYSTTLYNFQDTFNLPSNITNIARNLVIDRNLLVNGNVKFTNKNTNILEIFPKYSIIAWANKDIPKGWAMCDGLNYILNNNGIAEISFDTSLRLINTPDLRSKSILKYEGQPSYIIRSGSEKIKIRYENLPRHSHIYNIYGSTIEGYEMLLSTYSKTEYIPIGYKSSYLRYDPDTRKSYNQLLNTALANPISFATKQAIFDKKQNGDTLTDLEEMYIRGIRIFDRISTKTVGSDQYESVIEDSMAPYYSLYYIMKL
jgi:hypothetical protein